MKATKEEYNLYNRITGFMDLLSISIHTTTAMLGKNDNGLKVLNYLKDNYIQDLYNWVVKMIQEKYNINCEFRIDKETLEIITDPEKFYDI
jgi:hypothetical protein